MASQNIKKMTNGEVVLSWDNLQQHVATPTTEQSQFRSQSKYDTHPLLCYDTCVTGVPKAFFAAFAGTHWARTP